MIRVLVIGEKPSQVKTMAQTILSNSRIEKISKYLYLRIGYWKEKELTFIPLIGHITTIDTTEAYGWGKCEPIDIVRKPEALIIREDSKFKKLISQKAKMSDELWLATDPDSEGDNIAHEAYLMAISANPSLVEKTKRVWNSSLTKKEIIRSFSQLREWEPYLAMAVQGRRYVDAWVGFAGTREITKVARKLGIARRSVLSVGRVQLPTLKLIVDRDRQREIFNKQLKYNILAEVRQQDQKKETIVQHKSSPFTDKKVVDKILKKLTNTTKGKVIDFNTRITSQLPPVPLNTTAALSLLTRQLKIKADVAMTLLADLYEGGYISYPRTDNQRFTDGFPHKEKLLLLLNHIPYQKYIQQILDDQQVRNNGTKKGPEDHDPIFPTGRIPRESKQLSKMHCDAWDLLARYYIGLFMPDLQQERGYVLIDIDGELFEQKYQIIVKEGWTEGIWWKKPRQTPIFNFTVGEIVSVGNIHAESYQTKPPPKWSDSTLLKSLERLQIGTKSSRPEIIKKLIDRNYVVREGRFLESTPTGKTIANLFSEIWPELVTPNFTRMVEQYMDDVATKKSQYKTMLETLRDHYIKLHEELLINLPKLEEKLTEVQKKATNITQEKIQITDKKGTPVTSTNNRLGNCPNCGIGQIVERRNSKTDEIFFGCSNYPKCSWTSPAIKTKDGFKPSMTKKDILGPCPECSGNLIYRKTKKYRLIGCSNYPKCKKSHFLPKDGRITILKEKCPNDGYRLISYVHQQGEQKVKTIFCVVCNYQK